MEPSQWEQVLPYTYFAGLNDRKHAEQVIEQYLHQPNALGSLLSLLHTHEIREVKQAAAAVFKNRVKHFWMTEEETETRIIISDEEKEHIKAFALEVLLEERDKSIRDLLAEGIRSIAEVDFPVRWPGLLDLLLQNIQSNHPLRMQNALVTLRKVAKRYEFKGREDRDPLDYIVQTCFPILQQLFEYMLCNNSIEAAIILKLIEKIFWSATQYSLPNASNVDVNKFFEMFAVVIEMRLPEAHENVEPFGQPTSVEERNSWPWWKVKKWAMQIATRFLERYGNPRYAPEEYKAFAKLFREHTSMQLFGPVMNLIARFAQGEFCTDRVKHSALTFLCSAIELSPTYKAIKPHVESLVTQVIFPLLCLSDEDLWFFENDPQEFVRKTFDVLVEFQDPKMAATSLLTNLARYRGRDTLMPILGFLNTILVEYQNAAPDRRDFRQKDAALVAVCAICKVLKSKSELKQQLEGFVQAHVIPEFTSVVGILRARACWTITYFADIEYTDPTIMPAIVNGVLLALRDSSLVVQTNAATALKHLLDAESVDDVILPLLPEIINEFFRIMSEIENDVAVAALHVLVYRFGDHVGHLATGIVQRLCDAFMHLSALGAEDDEAAFAATTCLDTVTTIMDACTEDKILFAQLELAVMPVLLSLLQQEDCFEYIENVVEVLSYLTFATEEISQNLWSLFGLLVQALDRYAYDFIREILIPLDNYITKDPATFLAYVIDGRPAVETLLEIVKKTMDNDKELERDARAAMRLMMCIIHSCRGCIDPYVPGICGLMMEKSVLVKKEKTRLVMMDIVMSLVHYNPQMSLEYFAPMAENMFSAIFASIAIMETKISQRLIVLSFSSLFLLPSSMLPNIIRLNIGNIVSSVLRELQLMEEAEAQEQEAEHGGEDQEDEDEIHDRQPDEDEDEDEEYDEDELQAAQAQVMIEEAGGFHEDDDAVDPEEDTYHKTLDKLDREKVVRYMGGEPVQEEQEEKAEESDFVSPIENEDCGAFFFRALQTASQREPQLYDALQAVLPDEDKQRLQHLLQVMSQRAIQ